MENNLKSISTINPAIMKNTECSIVEACASFINLKVGVSLNHAVLRFASSFLNILCISPSKE